MSALKSIRDGWTWLGIALVAAAAAVMSFSSLWRLAERTTVPPSLAWLLPVTIDATIVVAIRVWLIGPARHRITRYARFLALSALALSVAGNAAERGMDAYNLVAPWWVLVAVSAIPPVALGATVHLAALLATTIDDTADSATPRVTEANPTRPDAQARTTNDDMGQRRPKTAAAKTVITPAETVTGNKAALMRATFDRYLAEGRLDELTGAELARAAGATPSLGRRYLSQWRVEVAETEERAA